MITPAFESLYHGKVRTRVCGVLIEDQRILLVGHNGLGENGVFWSVPGGAIEFGERAADALRREFLEETGLEVCVEGFLFANEFISGQLHAIELFFEVRWIAGELSSGHDPELEDNEQVITEVRFFPVDQLHQMPAGALPSFLANCDVLSDILEIRGYIASIEN